MQANQTNSEALALHALVWTLGDPGRASRLLDLTGLDASELRARASDPSLLAATLGFLEAHEPDLIACAEALEVKPTELVAARAALENA
jgi:hypothetical protein